MKYSEFLQLNEILEIQGTTLFKELGLNEDILNEKGEKPTVDVETPTISLITRWGRLKRKLNKQAQKVQKQINKNILTKYLPKLLDEQNNTLGQLDELSQKTDNYKELYNSARSTLLDIRKVQNEQFDDIRNVISKLLRNTTYIMDNKIEKINLSDKNKLNLKNYWLLLTAQIKMNSLSYIQETLINKAKETLGNNILAKKAFNTAIRNKETVYSDINNNYNEYKKDAENRKDQIRAEQEEMKREEKAEDLREVPITK